MNYLGFSNLFIIWLVCINWVNMEISIDFKVSSIISLILTNKLNCTDLISLFMKRCSKYNPHINALINMNPNVFKKAQDLDNYFLKHKKLYGKLHCIPIIVKDNIDICGIPTSGGIKALRYSIPNKNALVIDRLESAGAVFLAKSNMAELAFGLTYSSELGGTCRNPYDFERTCGLSSSGSACSIATGLSVISVGTDTTGSIIQPSAYNGVFGLRPFHDYKILKGVIPVFSRQDTVGPIAKYLEDLVLAASIMYDDNLMYENLMKSTNSRLKLKIISNFFNTSVLFSKSVKKFKDKNVEVIEQTLDNQELAIIDKLLQILQRQSTICLIASLNTSMNLYFNDQNRFDYDAPYHNFDSFITSPLLSIFWYEQFQRFLSYINKYNMNCDKYEETRKLFTKFIHDLFDINTIDAILVPSMTTVAPFLNESIQTSLRSDSIYLSFSVYTNLSFLSIPIGVLNSSNKELPIGIGLLYKKPTQINALKIAQILENVESKQPKL